MIKYAVRKLLIDGMTRAESRVYPSRLPEQYELEAIVIQKVFENRHTPHSGAAGELITTGLQLSLIAHTELDANRLAEECIALLHSKPSQSVVLGGDTVEIGSGFLEDSMDEFDSQFQKESEVLKILEFSFNWRKAA